MPSNQALPTQQNPNIKSAHIIQASNAKPNVVAAVATASPRVTTIVSTVPRKREHGTFCENIDFFR